MRWKRRRLLFRAFSKRRQLTEIRNRIKDAKGDVILCFSVVRNELERLPYFLDYHRNLGVNHFVMVDNESNDGTFEFLTEQEDVSLWRTSSSYRLSRFGMDWLAWLQIRYGHGRWCLTLDADELFIYPYHGSKSLKELTEFLDANGSRSFGAVMIDLYPKAALGSGAYEAGSDPKDYLGWFDGENYTHKFQKKLQNLWIQGGVRARYFFEDRPERAPTMNKIPLVKHNRRYVYVSSTHSMLPRKLNQVFPQNDKADVSGALLHTKFLPTIVDRSKEEAVRKEHFANSAIYDDYYHELSQGPVLWNSKSLKYDDWRQLEELGLMSSEGWQ